MSFEIQELPDVIKIVTLLDLHEKGKSSKKALKERLDVICTEDACIEPSDFEESLNEMVAEGIVTVNEFSEVDLTKRGMMLGDEWNNLLYGEEPIMETVAGLTDGSITGLIVILSSYLTGLDPTFTAFAALLTLASVALTNFSSFYLGGKTEDTRDLETLQRLINYSLSDIPDRTERSKSLTLISRLFLVLRRDLNRSSLWSAVVSGVTTFLAGIVPILLYMYLPEPLDMLLSLGFVGFVVVFFLVRYRARKMRLPLKVTFMETIVILVIVVAASLILGQRI